MNMNLTKENVEYFWKVLNSSSSTEDKKVADEYLRQFKESPAALDICLQLFDSTERGSHFLAAIVLHHIIKERINSIIESKDEFLKFRDLIFGGLIQKMKSAPGYIIERLCYTISILVSTGLITYWPESIEEIIQFAKSSKENLYLSLIILENINKEIFELNISSKTLMRIKDILVDKLCSIQEFIFVVLTSNQDTQLFNLTLKLTHSWIKLGLNVLKIPMLSQTLVTYLNADNVKNISEIFSDSMNYASSSKYYSQNEVYDLEEILSKYDKLELQSVENLVEMVKTSIININTNSNTNTNISQFQSNSDKLVILDGLANILSSILENFITLLFLKTPLSQTLNEMLYFFISHKNRKLSYKFFETISELREFINRGYKFSNFSDEEKIEYGNFLIKISESVMLNCKLKRLSINQSMLSKKENLTIEDIEIIQEQDSEKNDTDNNDIDSEEITVSINDYRKSSEDIFYNIFLIFTYNFGDDGAKFFFNWINNIISGLDINNSSISQDENRLLVFEIVLLVVRSILDTVDVSESNNIFIINFTALILNSNLLHNDSMIIKFLWFLDQACSCLGKAEDQSHQSIIPNLTNFLLNMSKNKLLECTASYILLEISDFLKTPNADCFKTIFEFYQVNYDNLTPLTVNHLGDALCNFIGVLDRDLKVLVNITDDEVINYYNFILQTATDRILKTFEYLQNMSASGNDHSLNTDNDYSKVKLEFLKNYNIHNAVLKKSYFLTKKVLRGVFNIHMNSTVNVTKAIFTLFVKDASFIREICKIYIKSIHHLAEDCSIFFDDFNEMMLTAYFNNLENFPCLSVLKVLYSEVARSDKDKKDMISRNFFTLCDQISKNVFLMKKNQIDLIDLFAQLIVKVLDTVDYLLINQEILANVISLFLEALKTISEPSMNKNVIRALTRILSEEKIIPRELTMPRFSDMIYGVFSACDHYDSSSIGDFTSFTLTSINYDENSFVFSLYNVFTNPKFKIFKKEHVELIAKYLTSIGRSDKPAKALLNDIVNITKGMGQIEALIQYAMQLALHERKQKLKNLKFLYSEYKNCMKNEFSEYFGKDDEYKSYYDKCFNQKNDIQTYMNQNLTNVYYVKPVREEMEVLNKYERKFNTFATYGWTAGQVKNYFLNYDQDKQEYDVWANHILARDSQENYGLPTERDKKEMAEQHLPTLFQSLTAAYAPKDLISSFKWTGKLSDQWNLKVFGGLVQPSQHFS